MRKKENMDLYANMKWNRYNKIRIRLVSGIDKRECKGHQSLRIKSEVISKAQSE